MVIKIGDWDKIIYYNEMLWDGKIKVNFKLKIINR